MSNALALCNKRADPIPDANHITIAKPDNQDSPQYLAFREALKESGLLSEEPGTKVSPITTAPSVTAPSPSTKGSVTPSEATPAEFISSREHLIKDLGYTKLENFQGGVEPGSIWRFGQGAADRVCGRPAFLPLEDRPVLSTSKIVFKGKDLSSEEAADVLGDHLTEALRIAEAESVEVDLGFTNIQEVSEEAFADIKYAEQWSPFYRERYELAKKEQDGLVVVFSVLVSRGDQIRVRGTTVARLKDVAEMLREERSTAYELKQEPDNSILIVASQSRAVAVGYRPLKASLMPSLALSKPSAPRP
jgi:hypothetical protein